MAFEKDKDGWLVDYVHRDDLCAASPPGVSEEDDLLYFWWEDMRPREVLRGLKRAFELGVRMGKLEEASKHS